MCDLLPTLTPGHTHEIRREGVPTTMVSIYRSIHHAASIASSPYSL